MIACCGRPAAASFCDPFAYIVSTMRAKRSQKSARWGSPSRRRSLVRRAPGRLEKLREIVARRLNVRVSESDRFVGVAADPGLIQLRVFLRSTLHATWRQQMHTYVTLTECMQPVEYLGRDRLQARNDQRYVECAIQISGLVQFSGSQRIVQIPEGEPRGIMVLRLRTARAFRHGRWLDLRAQPEDLINLQ